LVVNHYSNKLLTAFGLFFRHYTWDLVMFALKSQETRIDVGEQFIANLCLSERRSTPKGVERCCWFSLVWWLWTAVVTGKINISIIKYNTVHLKKSSICLTQRITFLLQNPTISKHFLRLGELIFRATRVEITIYTAWVRLALIINVLVNFPNFAKFSFIKSQQRIKTNWWYWQPGPCCRVMIRVCLNVQCNWGE